MGEADQTRKPKPRKLGRWWLLIVLVMLAGLVAALRLVPTTDIGRGELAVLLEGMKLGRLGWLHVEGIEGDPWRRVTVRRLTIRDKTGIWLDARNVSAAWRPGALLARQAHVETLTIGEASVLRRPVLLPAGKPKPSPVSVRLDHASGRLETLPAFSVNRGLYHVTGHLRLNRAGAPTGAVEVLSLLRKGDQLKATFAFGRRGRFALGAQAREASGGALAGALGLPPSRDFALDLAARGEGRRGFLELAVRSGQDEAARASGRWTAAGGEAQGRLSLASSTLLAPYIPYVGPEVRFQAEGESTGRDLYRMRVSAAGQKVAFATRGTVDVVHRATGPHGLAFAVRLLEPARLIKTGKSGPLAASGGFGGDQRHWVASGRADLEQPELGLCFTRISGPFKVEGQGRRIDIDASLAGEGASGGGLYGALLGPRPTAAARLELIGDGRTILRRVTLAGAAVKLDGHGEQGLLGGLTFAGRANLTDIGRVAAGAHGGLQADLTARQAGRSPWTFTIKSKADRFASGLAAADRLLGPTPALSAAGSFDGKTLALASASLSGKSAAVDAAGRIGPAGALKLALNWRASGPFAAGPLEIDGAASGKGDIGGTLIAPTADLLADFARLDLPSLPLRNAHVVLRLAKTGGGFGGRLGLTAVSEQGPARAAGVFTLDGSALDVSDLDAAAGGIAVKGGFTLADGAPSRADLTFVAGPGAFLAGGHASGRARIVETAGGPHADLSLQGAGVVLASGPELRTIALTARRFRCGICPTAPRPRGYSRRRPGDCPVRASSPPPSRPEP